MKQMVLKWLNFSAMSNMSCDGTVVFEDGPVYV